MVYICLLRGINVSGRNKVLMKELRIAFTKAGFNNVRSYIQSGNVIFTSKESYNLVLNNIKKILSQNYQFEIGIVLRILQDLKKIILLDPFEGAELNRKLVTFLSKKNNTFTSADVEMKKSETEEILITNSEIYLHCPLGYGITKLTNSYLEKITGVTCTTRNWRTIIKIEEIALNEGN